VSATVGLADVSCNSNLNPNGTLGAAVGAANLTGCLTAAGGGLVFAPDPGPWDSFTVAWQITPIVGGYHYEYTYDNGGQKNISHLLLGLSANCTEATTSRTPSTCIWNLSRAAEGPKLYKPSDPSNDGLPGDLWGIKQDSVSADKLTFSFDSNRIPVWQNTYMRDGKDSVTHTEVFAYNSGFGTGLNFVAAPDTRVVPEPSVYAVLAGGLGLILLAIRRKRQAAAANQ
jgi:hypothetical protein